MTSTWPRCTRILRATDGVEVVDDVATNQYPMPKDAHGKDAVLVGRLRRDENPAPHPEHVGSGRQPAQRRRYQRRADCGGNDENGPDQGLTSQFITHLCLKLTPMRPLLVSIMLLSACYGAQAQVQAADNSQVYTYVEQMPVFPGGQEALVKGLSSTIVYPTEALQQRISGKVIVKYVVDASGRVQDVQVARSAHPLLDAEAVRAVGTLPAYTPGQQSGRVVPVSLTLPIQFELPANIEQILATRTAAQSGKAATSGAQFPGGPEALAAYLEAVPYPEAAKASKAEGRIFVQCKISAEGKAEYINAIRPTENTSRRKAPSNNKAVAQSLLVQAAEQAVAAMPLWKPAISNGIPVASAQTLPVYFYLTSAPPSSVYVYADQMPVFEGATDIKRLEANIQRSVRYPAEALRNRMGGTALAYFEVDEQGQMSPVEILKPVYPAIDEEVARAVSTQKVLKPAMHQGKPVKVFYIIPLTFAIVR